MMNYIYILRCADGTLYTGWTNHLQKRIRAHQEKKGARYTRCRLPVELVYFEEHEDRISALRREYAVKQLSRKEKTQMIEAFDEKKLEKVADCSDELHRSVAKSHAKKSD